MTDLIQSLNQLISTNPLLGIFVTSIIGNVIPFFPVPYLLFVVFVASTDTGLSLIPVATIAALGASIGKFTSYTLGYGAGRAFSGSKTKFDSLRKLLGGSAFLAAFAFAALPLPDDVIFIPLGVMRYSPVKTFVSLFTGKFVLTLLIAYVARTSSGFLDVLTGGSLFASIASAGAVIIIAILMMRIDWEEVLAAGRKGAFRRLVKSLVRRQRGRQRGSQEDSDPSKEDHSD